MPGRVQFHPLIGQNARSRVMSTARMSSAATSRARAAAVPAAWPIAQQVRHAKAALGHLVAAGAFARHQQVGEATGRQAAQRDRVRFDALPPPGIPGFGQAVEIDLADGDRSQSPAANPGNEDKAAEIDFDPDALAEGRWWVENLISGQQTAYDIPATRPLSLGLPRKDGAILRLRPAEQKGAS